MKVLVDADACPVIGKTEQIAEKYGIPVTLLCDTNDEMFADSFEKLLVSIKNNQKIRKQGKKRYE